MKKSHKLTIVLLTYNRAEGGYLEQALNAILNQTYTDFELLVFDNYSNDNTSDIVLRYVDKRLYYVRQPDGGNPTTSYNHALWMSRGEYIIFTHDDDIMEPTIIERQMDFVKKHPNLLCLATNISLIDEYDHIIQPKFYDLEEDTIFSTGDYITKYFEEKLWFPAPTLLYHRDSYVKVLSKWLRMKNPEYFSSGDIWATISLNLRGPIGILCEPLLRYRQHAGQESRNVDQSAALINVIQLLLKYRGYNSGIQFHLPAIQGFLARFKTQDMLFKISGKKQTINKLSSIKKRWEKEIPPDKRAVDAVLPFEIFLCILGFEPTVPLNKFRELEGTSAKGGARRGFRFWLNAIHQGKTIFDGAPWVRKISIFGSMLNSFLIVQDAQRAGVKVFYCFDSSPSRIGEQVSGIPVISLEDLRRHANEIDAMILSSEHDQEEALKLILDKYLSQNPELPILSWKELALKASDCNNKVR
ncbi:glycosyltransferase [bacterium]|nr:glycosyltransferase [bacterium]